MAAKPRFLLMPVIVAATAGESAPLNWHFARGQTRGVSPAILGWRLLGANNRELGRSVGVYPLETAHGQILALQADAGRLGTTLALAPAGGWVWRASLDGVLVATAGRSYHRQRECHYSAVQFLAAVPAAAVCDHVLTKSDLLTLGGDGAGRAQSPFTGSTSGVRPRGCSA